MNTLMNVPETTTGTASISYPMKFAAQTYKQAQAMAQALRGRTNREHKQWCGCDTEFVPAYLRPTK